MIARKYLISSLVVVTTLSACQRSDSSADRETSTTTTTATQSDPDTTTITNFKVTWEADQRRDLTGDSREERLVAKAFGPTYDSLTVVLELFGPNGELGYRDTWSSGLYFVYDHRAGKADSTVERIVKGHLNRLLSDSAIIAATAKGPKAIIDSMTIRYDLAERRLREAYHLADTTELTIAQFDSLEKVSVSTSDVLQVMADVHSRPRFRYFAGGEVTYIVAWSERLKRFVRVFSCC